MNKEYAEGISDLILDLRYNGGGFARAEQILASLIGPEDEVLAGSVLATEVFNEDLTEYYKSKEIDTKTYFATEYDFSVNDKNYKFSTKGANAKAGKLYVIISSGTASLPAKPRVGLWRPAPWQSAGRSRLLPGADALHKPPGIHG